MITLYFWKPSEEDDPLLAAEVAYDGEALKLIRAQDPAFPGVMARVLKAPALDLPIEQLTGTGLALTMDRVSAGDPGYWAAVGREIAGEMGYVMTTRPEPPLFL